MTQKCGINLSDESSNTVLPRYNDITRIESRAFWQQRGNSRCIQSLYLLYIFDVFDICVNYCYTRISDILWLTLVSTRAIQFTISKMCDRFISKFPILSFMNIVCFAKLSFSFHNISMNKIKLGEVNTKWTMVYTFFVNTFSIQTKRCQKTKSIYKDIILRL